jgi:hypothetical protein
MSETNSFSEPIVCSATPWYLWQRVVPFSVIPLLMGAWFYYDYKVGYPEKLAIYQEKKAYDKNGKTAEWVTYSAERGWPKEPDEMDDRKVNEQLYWALGVGLLGVVSTVYHLLSYPRKLRGDANSFTPPWGPQIPFADVVKIDRRPWKLKGLAKVYYQKNGAIKKASIDDLRFKGADGILERLQSNFTGEILELEEPTTEAEAESKTEATSPES